MTLRERIARLIWPGVNDETQQRASSTSGAAYEATSGYAVEPPSDTLSELGHGTSHPYLFSCINTIATAAMGVPFRVYSLEPIALAHRSGRRRYLSPSTVRRAAALAGTLPPADYRRTLRAMGLQLEEVDDSHPLRTLLDDVNPLDTWPEFVNRSIFHLVNTGDSYWEMVGGKGGKAPTELWIMQPDRVRVNPDPKDFIKGYTYTVGATEIVYDRDQVLHCRLPHPSNEFYGLSRVDPLQMVLSTDRSRAIYNNGFFERGAMMSGMLVPDGEIDQASWERATQLWVERYTGVRNMGKVGLFNAPLKFVQTSVNPRDAEFSGMKEENEHDISGVTGVPRALTGRTSEVNRSNMDVLEGLFWQHTMVPLLGLFSARLTVDLAPRYGEGIVVEADTSEVAALTEDETAIIDRTTRAYEAGIITLNEARRLTGRDPIDGGDVLKVSTTVQLKPVETIGEETAPEPPEDATPPPPDDEVDETDEEPQDTGTTALAYRPQVHREFGDARHKRIWGSFDDTTQPRVRSLEQAVWDLFRAQEDAILEALRAQRNYRATVPTDAVLFDKGDAANQLWRVVRDHSGDATAAAAEQTIADLGISMTFDTRNPLVLEYLTEKELVIKTIPDTLHEALRAELLQGNAAGEPIAKIAKRIEAVYDGVQGYRARRIAQTEIVGAYNVGNVAAMDQAGVTKKEWVATLDDRVRDSHSALHGEVVGIAKQFSNGLQYPGDPAGGPDEVVNCRCTCISAEV